MSIASATLPCPTLPGLQVQSATGAVGASFKKLGASLSSLGRRKADDAPGTEHVPQVLGAAGGVGQGAGWLTVAGKAVACHI